MGARSDKEAMQDFEEVKRHFPKLRTIALENGNVLFEGDIDIFDQQGVYWNTYNIRITVPTQYPRGVPDLYEVSQLIERVIDRHIDHDGLCCVGVSHELFIRAHRDFRIIEFLNEYAYPYLANQSYFMVEGHFVGFEYKHGFGGVIQFYQKLFKTQDYELIFKFIDSFLHTRLPRYGDMCWCGSVRKYRKCHLLMINELKKIPKNQLKSDLSNFQLIRTPQVPFFQQFKRGMTSIIAGS